MSDKLSQDDIDNLLNAIGESADASSSSSVSPESLPFFTEEEIRDLPLYSSVIFPGETISVKESSNKPGSETIPWASTFLQRQEKGIFRIDGCECGYLSVTPTDRQKGKIIVHKPEMEYVDTGQIKMSLHLQLSTISLPSEFGEPVKPGTVIPLEMFNPDDPVTVRAKGYPLCYAEVLAAGKDFAVRLTEKAGQESVSSGDEELYEAFVLLGTKEVTLEEVRSFTEGTILVLDQTVAGPLDIEYRGEVLFQGYIVASEKGFAVRVAGSSEVPEDVSTEPAGRNGELSRQPGRTLSGPRFSFLSRDDISSLLSVLRDEPGDIIALVLSYIDPDIAGTIFAQLDREQQVEVGRIMAEGRPVDRSLAAVVEAELYSLLRE